MKDCPRGSSDGSWGRLGLGASVLEEVWVAVLSAPAVFRCARSFAVSESLVLVTVPSEGLGTLPSVFPRTPGSLW